METKIATALGGGLPLGYCRIVLTMTGYAAALGDCRGSRAASQWRSAFYIWTALGGPSPTWAENVSDIILHSPHPCGSCRCAVRKRK